MNADNPGYEIAFLLIGSFRRVIEDLHVELTERGYPEARPAHGFALQAIGPDAVTIVELGRRLGVSKQAAAKTVKTLDAIGYIVRRVDPADARASLVRRSDRGNEMLRVSAEIFARQKRDWIAHLGAERFDELIADLRLMSAGTPIGDMAAWLQ